MLKDITRPIHVSANTKANEELALGSLTLHQILSHWLFLNKSLTSFSPPTVLKPSFPICSLFCFSRLHCTPLRLRVLKKREEREKSQKQHTGSFFPPEISLLGLFRPTRSRGQRASSHPREPNAHSLWSVSYCCSKEEKGTRQKASSWEPANFRAAAIFGDLKGRQLLPRGRASLSRPRC